MTWKTSGDDYPSGLGHSITLQFDNTIPHDNPWGRRFFPLSPKCLLPHLPTAVAWR
jgi:hypothetical protein